MSIPFHDIKSVTYLKNNVAKLMEEIEQNPPMGITQHGEVRAVLMSAEEYQGIQNRLAMLQLIALGDEDIRRGNTRPASEVISRVKSRIANHKPASE